MRGKQRDVANRKNLCQDGERQRSNYRIWIQLVFILSKERPLYAPWSSGSCAVAHRLVLETPLSSQSQRGIVVSETRGARYRGPCAFGLAYLQRDAKRRLASCPCRGTGCPGSRTWQMTSYGGTEGFHSHVGQRDMNIARASSMVWPTGRSHRRAVSRRLVSRIHLLRCSAQAFVCVHLKLATK